MTFDNLDGQISILILLHHKIYQIRHISWDLRSSTDANLLTSFGAGSCKVANETERRFLLSHVFCPVHVICTSFKGGRGGKEASEKTQGQKKSHINKSSLYQYNYALKITP